MGHANSVSLVFMIQVSGWVPIGLQGNLTSAPSTGKEFILENSSQKYISASAFVDVAQVPVKTRYITDVLVYTVFWARICPRLKRKTLPTTG